MQLGITKDLQRPSSPTPLQWAGTSSPGSGCSEPRPTWPGMVPGMGGISHLPGQPGPGFHHPHSKKFLPYIQSKSALP